MGSNVSGSADMTDLPMVRACASPLINMVRDSSAAVANGASHIPFKRSSRIRRLPWRCRSLTILEQTMAMRKRDDEVVFPNAAGIDVGASSRWVVVPPQATEEPVREFGAMTAT